MGSMFGGGNNSKDNSEKETHESKMFETMFNLIMMSKFFAKEIRKSSLIEQQSIEEAKIVIKQLLT